MAAQGGNAPAEARGPGWWIVNSAVGEEIFAKCGCCGQKIGPMYQVIRVSDKQDSEWHRLGKFGKEWNAGYPLATLATVLAFGITFGIGLGLLPEARLDQYQHMLLGIVLASMAVAGIVILGTVLPMNRYNRKVRANRKRLQAAFLAQFGAMTPDEVATPYSWGGGIKYALVPDGVNNELQYQTY